MSNLDILPYVFCTLIARNMVHNARWYVEASKRRPDSGNRKATLKYVFSPEGYVVTEANFCI